MLIVQVLLTSLHLPPDRDKLIPANRTRAVDIILLCGEVVSLVQPASVCLLDRRIRVETRREA